MNQLFSPANIKFAQERQGLSKNASRERSGNLNRPLSATQKRQEEAQTNNQGLRQLLHQNFH